MPLLAGDDDIVDTPRRVVVAGTSGSGKTTLAARIGDRLGLPHIEIDGLFHGPGWTQRPSFEADVEDFSRGDRWVTEWQYSTVRQRLADRAELMVWLDLPRATVMHRVVSRTLRRRRTRQVLWNGNVEPPLRTIATDPEHIIRWAWTTHRKTRRRVLELAERRPEMPIVRLRSRREVDRWLERLR
jgi:adenylate kinase family enzyme